MDEAFDEPHHPLNFRAPPMKPFLQVFNLPNGITLTFDENGNQVPELQGPTKTVMKRIREHPLLDEHFDPDRSVFRIITPREHEHDQRRRPGHEENPLGRRWPGSQPDGDDT